ncbi:MAG: phosphoribosylglycinamide formyltransferase [Clostridiales bacterium]|jgi:phosphoribosylglycinamide formyltransferase-1|nr:phosphoribosylglycinamide formyltransferase [Clostridiales bacterium]
MLNITVLVSGGGTNLQALLDAQSRGEIQNGQIHCVISSNPNAYALERAKKAEIDTEVILRKTFETAEQYDQALVELLKKHDTDLIVLAGFMTIIGRAVVEAYPNRIVNVHPALIPSFCGKGYYGLRVHQAALDAGVRITGATVHLVDEVCDGGAILMQKAVEVRQDDTPESLQRRVMEQAEWKLLPQAVSLICQGKIQVQNGKAIIKE